MGHHLFDCLIANSVVATCKKEPSKENTINEINITLTESERGEKRMINKVPLSTLEMMFEEIRFEQVTEDKLVNLNRTDKFFKELEDIIKYKELINIAVIGKVATGKSTVAMSLGKYILEELLGKVFSIKNICDDQLTFSRVVKNVEVKNTCYVIDEDNRLSRAYLGSTIETTVLQSFSEIQAQRFIHRIYCSPFNIEDMETHIILEIISADKRQKFTKCKLYYRKNTPLGIITQILGYVDIDVSNIVGTQTDIVYKKMKFAKMDLMNKYGINDRRALDDSKIILTAYKNLEGLTKATAVSRALVGLYVRKIKFDLGLNLSILQEDSHTSDIDAMLRLKREINVMIEKGFNVQKDIRTELLNELIQRYEKTASVYETFINLKYEDLN